MGLLISTFLRSQIAAIFGTAVLTLLPATLFSGMIDPVSSLEGGGAPLSRKRQRGQGTFSLASRLRPSLTTGPPPSATYALSASADRARPTTGFSSW